ncbi:MAG TPA: PIN domain-containing protein [Thermoanaerobaculia bacterium]|nr:PIN domain-containing protein [Thermoanaerobaculia bacterium]
MNLYADSSAILSWIFGELEGLAVREVLAAADSVLASDLTLVECDRTILRAQTAGTVTEVQAAERRDLLIATAAHWHLLRLDAEVLERARRPFPAEPIRTLDALHLASALAARALLPDLVLLSLDKRMRAAGQGLGFVVRPA